jgi:hypothetical protein
MSSPQQISIARVVSKNRRTPISMQCHNLESSSIPVLVSAVNNKA